VIALESGPNISTARNKIVREFLDNHRAPWLLMIDTDMVWSATALDRLIAANKPVIGGLCYSYADGEVQPTMYELVPKASGMGSNGRIHGSKVLYCVLLLRVQRSYLSTVMSSPRCQSPPRTYPRRGFVNAGGFAACHDGEDMTFCLRLAAMEIPVHVHTGVQIGHMKFTMLGKVL